MSKLNRLREVRTKSGLSQVEVSKRTGLSPAVLSYIENGQVLPTMENIEALCSLFSCSPTDIFDLSQFRSADADGVPRKATGTRKADERFYVHIGAEEKDELFRAIRFLGFQSSSEWFREMMRKTVNQYHILYLMTPAGHAACAPAEELPPNSVIIGHVPGGHNDVG